MRPTWSSKRASDRNARTSVNVAVRLASPCLRRAAHLVVAACNLAVAVSCRLQVEKARFQRLTVQLTGNGQRSARSPPNARQYARLGVRQ